MKIKITNVPPHKRFPDLMYPSSGKIAYQITHKRNLVLIKTNFKEPKTKQDQILLPLKSLELVVGKVTQDQKIISLSYDKESRVIVATFGYVKPCQAIAWRLDVSKKGYLTLKKLLRVRGEELTNVTPRLKGFTINECFITYQEIIKKGRGFYREYKIDEIYSNVIKELLSIN